MRIEQFQKKEFRHQIDNPNRNEAGLDHFIIILTQFLDALGEFEGNYQKKLNVSKLAVYLKLSASHLEKIITLIMACQKMFNSTLKDHWIKPTLINNITYLITEAKPKQTPSSKIIHLSRAEHQAFNDYFYTFKFVKKEQGIPLQNNSPFLENVRQLYVSHPYLFRKNGENLLYPSKIGLKLGEVLQSHHKCNKKVDQIDVEPYHFIFE